MNPQRFFNKRIKGIAFFNPVAAAKHRLLKCHPSQVFQSSAITAGVLKLPQLPTHLPGYLHISCVFHLQLTVQVEANAFQHPPSLFVSSPAKAPYRHDEIRRRVDPAPSELSYRDAVGIQSCEAGRTIPTDNQDRLIEEAALALSTLQNSFCGVLQFSGERDFNENHDQPLTHGESGSQPRSRGRVTRAWASDGKEKN